MPQKRLGVDIGGVIIDRINDNTDTSFFGDNYLATTAVPGVFETLARLNGPEIFNGQVYLVSKAGRRTQERTIEWLAHHRFHEKTGIPPDHVHFCRDRQGKVPICQGLGITHFIDDRLEVLYYLRGVVSELILFGEPSKSDRDEYYDKLICSTIFEWSDINEVFLSIMGFNERSLQLRSRT